ncbi:MAG: deoxyribonuclease IV [Gemmatimonadota bacterium]|nr:MAG: deoxyribonuclease IV [Gemmatimonadota bacterium]
MRFGFHISIAGGFSKVVERATALGCESIQLFSRNPRGWKYGPLDVDDVAQFRRDVEAAGIGPVVVHMPYLPNLAHSKGEHFKKSVDSLIDDLKRCRELGAQYLVTHVGKRMDSTEEEGVQSVVKALNTACKKVRNSVLVLLENTAGQGSEIGYTFHHIQEIIGNVDEPERVGVCFDTSHGFEAGYNVSTKVGLSKMLKEFDERIGLERLRVLHLNDSKTPLGSRVDRHWHIGQGEIGLEGFRRIVNHPKLKHLPGIMETPKKEEGDDERNMKTIRRLVGKR